MAKSGMSWEQIAKLASELPEVKESRSYGTRALRARGRLLARVLPEGDIAVRVEVAQRQALLATRPEAFFLTDFYRSHPMVLVRLAEVDAATMRRLLREAWTLVGAGKRKHPPRTSKKREGASPSGSGAAQ